MYSLDRAQYSTPAPSTHYLAPLFTKALDAFMSGQDPTAAAAKNHDSDFEENADLAFAIEIKAAVSTEDLIFESSAGMAGDRKVAFEGYSRFFKITDAQDKPHQYVLRDNAKNGIELAQLDGYYNTVEKAITIASYPNLTLNELRAMISTDSAIVAAFAVASVAASAAIDAYSAATAVNNTSAEKVDKDVAVAKAASSAATKAATAAVAAAKAALAALAAAEAITDPNAKVRIDAEAVFESAIAVAGNANRAASVADKAATAATQRFSKTNDASLPQQAISQDVTPAYPAEVMNLISVFTQTEKLQEDDVKKGLEQLVLNPSRPSAIATIKIDAGIFQSYRLTEQDGCISINRMLLSGMEDAEYVSIPCEVKLTLKGIKENFPSPPVFSDLNL